MTNYASAYERTFPFSDTAIQLNLLAGAGLPFTIPGTSADIYRCTFSWAYNANVYVGYNVTPTIQAGGTVTSSPNVEFRPGFDGSARYVKGGDVLNFISVANVTDSGFSLLKLPSQL